MLRSLVGSEMCIRDSSHGVLWVGVGIVQLYRCVGVSVCRCVRGCGGGEPHVMSLVHTVLELREPARHGVSQEEDRAEAEDLAHEAQVVLGGCGPPERARAKALAAEGLERVQRAAVRTWGRSPPASALLATAVSDVLDHPRSEGGAAGGAGGTGSHGA